MPKPLRIRMRELAILVSFVAACIGAYAVTAHVPPAVVDRMLKSDVERRAAVWNTRVQAVLEDAERSFRTGVLTGRDLTFLSFIAPASDIYQFELYQGDGTIFWTTGAGNITGGRPESYFFTVVAEGNTYYAAKTVPVTEFPHLAGVPGVAAQRRVAEIYTPVFADGRFVGAVEFYTDITDARAAFIARVRMLLAAVSVAALAILALIAGSVARAGYIQMRQLRAQAENEQELLAQQVRLAREVRLLGELNEWLQSSRSLDELFEMVSRFMSHILPGCEGSIYVYSNSRDVLDGCASWNGGQHHDHIRPEDCWGLRRGRTFSFGASEVEFVCHHAASHDGRAYFCFPILAHGDTVGLLHLRATDRTRSDEFRGVQRLAQMCAEQVSMAIANVRMRDELRDQSVRDPLTGLYNRRHLVDALRHAIGLARGDGTRLAVVSLDVDHFKRFNDTHGHDAGDMALRALGTALDRFCEGREIACRMGGEEFVILVPGAERAPLEDRLEDLRRSIEAIRIRYGDRELPRISASFGVAFHPEHGEFPQDLLRASDEALYDAKGAGRNRVVFCGAAVAGDEHARTEDGAGLEAPSGIGDLMATGDDVKTVAPEAPARRTGADRTAAGEAPAKPVPDLSPKRPARSNGAGPAQAGRHRDAGGGGTVGAR